MEYAVRQTTREYLNPQLGFGRGDILKGRERVSAGVVKMAMLSTTSWWLKSRVLLWWGVSVSVVCLNGINNSQTRTSKRTDATLPTPSLSIHHLSTDSGVAYSSMPHDDLPANGTTAPSRPAQQTPHTLRSSIAYSRFKSTECTCPVTMDLPKILLVRPRHSSSKS